MAVRRGTYLLVITLERPRLVRVGALGEHLFDTGTYVYAGSAMGGLDQRVSRHLSKCKTIRWHVDYLTTVCDRCEAYESYPEFIPECSLADAVQRHGGIPEMRGFGCSDCHCVAHLFRVDPRIVSEVVSDCALAVFASREPL